MKLTRENILDCYNKYQTSKENWSICKSLLSLTDDNFNGLVKKSVSVRYGKASNEKGLFSFLIKEGLEDKDCYKLKSYPDLKKYVSETNHKELQGFFESTQSDLIRIKG